MKYFNIALSVFLFLILFLSCTETIDIKLDSTTQRIAIEAVLSDEMKQHKVVITKSGDYFQNVAAEKVSGAMVTLNDGTNTFNVQEVEPGIYQTDSLQGEVGKTYTLNVKIEETTYSASGTMFACPPLQDSIHIIENPWNDSEADIQVSFTDPADEENYYSFIVYNNGVLVTDSLKEVSFTEDRFYNGITFENISVVGISKLNYGDFVTIELQAIEKACYEYYIKIKKETQWSGGPFSGPPANINGNFSNGALGFFRVYSQSKMSGIYPLRE